MKLITTAWLPKDPQCKSVTLLNEWCRIYCNPYFDQFDYVKVLPYHWDDRKKLADDYLYLETLYEKYIKTLAKHLNNYHRLNYNIKFYKILLGLWLKHFLIITYDKWELIHQALPMGLQTILFSEENNTNKAVSDSLEALELFQCDIWNHNLILEVIKFVDPRLIELREFGKLGSHTNSSSNLKQGGKRNILINKLLLRLKRDHKYIIGHTGLGKLGTLKLLVYLRQPSLFLSPILDTKQRIDNKLRIKLESDRNALPFEIFFSRVVLRYVPKIFMECLGKNIDTVKNAINIHKAPKSILTSVDHYYNDGFKLFTALATNSSTKLIIAGHGGGADHKFNGSGKYEKDISDIFLTTGPGNIFNTKTMAVGQVFNRSNKIHRKNASDILLLCVAMHRFPIDIRPLPIASQMINYFQNQFKFAKKLKFENQRRLRVRLYKDDYHLKQRERWADIFPEICITPSDESYFNSLSSARIVICTYNATTFNETFAYDIPTLIFWNPTFNEIHSTAKRIFKELEEVGIFHKTSEGAAEFLNNNIRHIEQWWSSDKVKLAVKKYCKLFAKENKSIVKDIANIVKFCN